MKRTLLLATLLLLGIQSYAQTGVAINTTGNDPDTSAMLDVSSTTKGLLIPRMTQAQRTAIALPAKGLLVYQNDSIEGFYYYDGSAWTNLALVNFTESNFTYNSRTGVKFIPNNAAADVDLVLQPKRYGAIIAQQPDGTDTGGNRRGFLATDLQRFRTNAAKVASGNYATIVGGQNNTASGENSTAMGSGVIASGILSTAMGGGTKASGHSSTAMGSGSTASGNYSTAMGRYTTAPSYYETALGSFNTNYTPVYSDDWDDTDRLFVVGNGTFAGSRSNALTILKNANTTIGGSLTLNGNGTNASITFPTSRGTSGQVLQTDGNGGTSWGTAASQWTTSGSNIYYNAGNVGIGTSTTNAQLQLSNSIINRKIVMYQIDDNDHQFYGLGINSNTLRYQVLSASDRHVFYAGASSSSSNELFRIQGNGQIVIPAFTDNGIIQTNTTGVLSSTKGTANQVLKMNSAGTATEWGNETDPSVPAGTAPGQMQYWNGTAWVTIAPGTTGQLLSINSSGIPQWQSQLSIITASTLTPIMTSSGVTFKGVVNPNNLYAAHSFEYGTTTDYGNTTETTYYTPSSTTNTISSSLITGLTVGLTYHVRLISQTILGTFYSNDITFTYLYSGAPLYPGATYQEGLVFYLDETGEHGKVCAFYDQSASATWYDALDICAAYSSGTVAPIIYDDWYLPSSADLTLMYNNLKLNNSGSFSNSFYWSFEAFDDTQAFYVNFENGNVAFGDKNANFKVRAVRDF